MFHDNKGMTLIEVMFAFVLLMIVSLALLKMTLMATNANIVNEMRDQAVSVAEQRMNELRNTPFTDSVMAATGTSGAVDSAITGTVRSTLQSFTPKRFITDINSTTKQVTVTVTWVYKGKTYDHSVTTILRNQ